MTDPDRSLAALLAEIEHVEPFCEQVARDGIMPSQQSFTDVAGLLAAAARVIRGQQEWQPIETAPDGEDVFVFIPDHNEEYQLMVCHLLDGDWYLQDADVSPDPLDVTPTHWMPLPAPPEALASAPAERQE